MSLQASVARAAVPGNTRRYGQLVSRRRTLEGKEKVTDHRLCAKQRIWRLAEPKCAIGVFPAWEEQ